MLRATGSRPLAAVALVLALACALAGPARPADLRIGYIDSKRIFQEFKDAQEAQSRFDRQVQGWRDEAAEKERAVKALRDEMRDQSAILSTLKRQEKEEALQRAISDYELFIQDTWGPTGTAAKENEIATRKVVDQIRSAVEKVAGDKGLELVLDSASGFILYADHSLDLTGDVLLELSARAQGGGSH